MSDTSHFNKMLNQKTDHATVSVKTDRAATSMGAFDQTPLIDYHNEKMGRTDAAPSMAFEPGDKVQRTEYDSKLNKINMPVETVVSSAPAAGWITTDKSDGQTVADWKFEHAAGTEKAAIENKALAQVDAMWSQPEKRNAVDNAKVHTKAFWEEVLSGTPAAVKSNTDAAEAAQRQEAKIQVVDQAAMARLWRGEASAEPARAADKTAEKGSDIER